MAAAITGIIDCVARLYSSYTWALNIGLSSFLQVWLLQIIFHPFMGLIVILECIRHCHRKRNHFAHGYLIYALYCFAIALVQTLVPSILLTLAYPTQMIAIITFVPMYLFTLTALLAVCIEGFQLNLFRLQNDADAERNMLQAWLCYIGSFAVIIVATLITMFTVLIFIYLELIGRGSGGPPFIICAVLAAIVTKLFLTAIARIVFSNGERRQ